MSSFTPKNVVIVMTHDMHTGGEPVRILKSGYPALKGSNVLEKIEYARSHFDNFRKLLINEPRGHKDMYGAIVMQQKQYDNEIDVIFIHNEGYSSMCGHAVIALGRYVVDCGLVKPTSPETKVIFNCPCGPVETYVQYSDGKSGPVRFHSVPAFVYKLGVQISVPNIGTIEVDISFGGAFYVIVEDKCISVDLKSTPLAQLVDAAAAVTETVKEKITLHHPKSKDLAFIYGTIITDGCDKYSDGPSTNLCVFADKEVDRSPTGSGVTARIALQVAKGLVDLNQQKEFRSIIGTSFTGKAVKETEFGDFKAVIVEVSGMAYHTGSHTFYLEENDPLVEGFQLPR